MVTVIGLPTVSPVFSLVTVSVAESALSVMPELFSTAVPSKTSVSAFEFAKYARLAGEVNVTDGGTAEIEPIKP